MYLADFFTTDKMFVVYIPYYYNKYLDVPYRFKNMS